MQSEILVVSNVKCQGCVQTIHARLMTLPGVSEVVVDQPTGTVTVMGEGLDRGLLGAELAQIGYPEKA